MSNPVADAVKVKISSLVTNTLKEQFIRRINLTMEAVKEYATPEQYANLERIKICVNKCKVKLLYLLANKVSQIVKEIADLYAA